MLTRCLGREETLEALTAALAAARWVTVTGPHGCGKTLLVRHAVVDRPAVWVDAVGLRTGDEVVAACLETLGIERAPGDTPVGSLRRALDESGTLLVVDGVEVEDESLSHHLQEVVESTDQARLVVTSTAHAGQPLERVVRMGPLPVPPASGPVGSPAAELFATRVREAGGQVDLPRHEDDVRRLLRATGGLPLLIEQVAVQCATLGIANVVPQATLSEAFAGAYDVLTPDEQVALRRLAHLGVPASIGVVAAVCDVSLPCARTLLTGLVRRNLVELHGDGRFSLLAPVREYALTRAAQTPDAPTSDADACTAGLLRWADSMAPQHDNLGAGDAAWLPDLAAMRAAVEAACAQDETRDLGYSVANRIFSSLYTAMRPHEAVKILETALRSGDGPGVIGAQVARRAGIAASELRGTYEGLWLLDRADHHAQQAADPGLELARNASIRAEMHLDAGDFARAESEALRAIELDPARRVELQAVRTLVDLHVSRGEFTRVTTRAAQVLTGSGPDDERWIGLSVRVLLGRTALEQGRLAEAEAFARTAARESRVLAEDRIQLLAETLLRQIDPSAPITTTERTTLPWAVRLPVLLQDARDLLESGDVAHAAGLAADVVALADSSQLGRDAVEGRLILGWALMGAGDLAQAAQTFRTALEQAAALPMPLRVADALDGLALVGEETDHRESRVLATAAAVIRGHHGATAWGLPARRRPVRGRSLPPGWVVDGCLTTHGLKQAHVTPSALEPQDTVLSVLTKAEREIAERVADGLTSRQIAQALFVSPRTVDTHLTNIYRKLDISSRAKLAALVVDTR